MLLNFIVYIQLVSFYSNLKLLIFFTFCFQMGRSCRNVARRHRSRLPSRHLKKIPIKKFKKGKSVICIWAGYAFIKYVWMKDGHFPKILMYSQLSTGGWKWCKDSFKLSSAVVWTVITLNTNCWKKLMKNKYTRSPTSLKILTE